MGSIWDITATEDMEGTPQSAQSCGQTAPAEAVQGRLTGSDSKIHVCYEVPRPGTWQQEHVLKAIEPGVL